MDSTVLNHYFPHSDYYTQQQNENWYYSPISTLWQVCTQRREGETKTWFIVTPAFFIASPVSRACSSPTLVSGQSAVKLLGPPSRLGTPVGMFKSFLTYSPVTIQQGKVLIVQPTAWQGCRIRRRRRVLEIQFPRSPAKGFPIASSSPDTGSRELTTL